TAARRQGAPSGRSARGAPLARRARATLPATAGGTGSSWPADSRRFPPPSGMRTNSQASEHLPKNTNRPRLENWGVAADPGVGVGLSRPFPALRSTGRESRFRRGAATPAVRVDHSVAHGRAKLRRAQTGRKMELQRGRNGTTGGAKSEAHVGGHRSDREPPRAPQRRGRAPPPPAPASPHRRAPPPRDPG